VRRLPHPFTLLTAAALLGVAPRAHGQVRSQTVGVVQLGGAAATLTSTAVGFTMLSIYDGEQQRSIIIPADSLAAWLDSARAMVAFVPEVQPKGQVIFASPRLGSLERGGILQLWSMVGGHSPGLQLTVRWSQSTDVALPITSGTLNELLSTMGQTVAMTRQLSPRGIGKEPVTVASARPGSAPGPGAPLPGASAPAPLPVGTPSTANAASTASASAATTQSAAVTAALAGGATAMTDAATHLAPSSALTTPASSSPPSEAARSTSASNGKTALATGGTATVAGSSPGSAGALAATPAIGGSATAPTGNGSPAASPSAVQLSALPGEVVGHADAGSLVPVEGVPLSHGVVTERTDADELGRYVRTHGAQLQFCYQEFGLKENPRLAGTVTVAVIIAATGEVTKSSIAHRTWSGPGANEAEACIRERVAGWHFPTSSQGAGSATFRFSFTSGR